MSKKCYRCPSRSKYCAFFNYDGHCEMYEECEGTPVEDECPAFKGMSEEEIKEYEIDVENFQFHHCDDYNESCDSCPYKKECNYDIFGDENLY